MLFPFYVKARCLRGSGNLHCILKYDPETCVATVKDMSSNGTYVCSGLLLLPRDPNPLSEVHRFLPIKSVKETRVFYAKETNYLSALPHRAPPMTTIVGFTATLVATRIPSRRVSGQSMTRVRNLVADLLPPFIDAWSEVPERGMQLRSYNAPGSQILSRISVTLIVKSLS